MPMNSKGRNNYVTNFQNYIKCSISLALSLGWRSRNKHHDIGNHDKANFSTGIQSRFCEKEGLLQIATHSCQKVDIVCN